MTDEKHNLPESKGPPVAPDDDDNAVGADGDIATGKEIGGRQGPDPTRYGDWEKDGRCIDF